MSWLLWIAFALLWVGLRQSVPPILNRQKSVLGNRWAKSLPLVWSVGNTFLVLYFALMLLMAGQQLYGWASLVLLIVSILWGAYRVYQHYLGIACFWRWKWNAKGIKPLWQGNPVEIMEFQAFHAVIDREGKRVVLPYSELMAWALPANNKRPPILILRLEQKEQPQKLLEKQLHEFLLAQPEIIPAQKISIELSPTDMGIEAKLDYSLTKSEYAERVANRVRERFEKNEHDKPSLLQDSQ